MLYTGQTLTALADELKSAGKALVTEGGNLQTAAGKLAKAWEDNEGLVAFNASKNKWDQEFGAEGDVSPETTIGKINALSAAVEQALHNALNADGKVAGAFGA